MSNPVSGFRGEALYVDTMIFHLLIRAKQTEVQDLFHRIENGELLAYTSVLTFDELVYRLLLGFIRDELPGSPIDHLRQNQQTLVARFYSLFQSHLDKFLHFPNLQLIDVTDKDMNLMTKNIKIYQLLPRDALHLAAMQKVGCMHIVSHDAGFDHIAGLHRYTLT